MSVQKADARALREFARDPDHPSAGSAVPLVAKGPQHTIDAAASDKDADDLRVALKQVARAFFGQQVAFQRDQRLEQLEHRRVLAHVRTKAHLGQLLALETMAADEDRQF